MYLYYYNVMTVLNLTLPHSSQLPATYAAIAAVHFELKTVICRPSGLSGNNLTVTKRWIRPSHARALGPSWSWKNFLDMQT
jgi:hypothetical protein